MRTVASSSGPGGTLHRLLAAIARRRLTVFAQIEHAAAARQVGMELREAVLVVFGDPLPAPH